MWFNYTADTCVKEVCCLPLTRTVTTIQAVNEIIIFMYIHNMMDLHILS